MYNNLSNMEERELDMSIKENEAIVSKYKALGAVMDAIGVNNIEPVDANERKYWEMTLEGLQPEEISDYNIDDLYSVMDDATTNGFSSDRIKIQWQNKMNNLALSYGQSGKFKGFANDINNQIDMIGSNTTRDSEQRQTDAYKFAVSSIDNLVDGFGRYLENNSEALQNIKLIVQNMSSWRGKSKYDTNEKEKFMEDMGNIDLNRDIKEFIFDNYKRHVETRS